MTFKQKIHQYYLQQVQDKIDAFRDMIAALTEDSKNDAKGSAGDKHETALSMMHLEQEKLNRKLAEFLEQKAILGKIDSASHSDKIVVGSVVQVNEMLVFVATALPKITIDAQTVLSVSPQSPLASKLLGHVLGETVEVNGTRYEIKKVL